jgi:nucleotide-binding universal stress UspA family protein
MCALIIGVACLGKFGGSTIAARLTGLGWREAAALGILMNTRGLMELIVLNIGLDLGVLSPTLFTMMVIMALVTTFMTTPLLQWVYPPSVVAAEEAPPEVAAPALAPSFTVLMCVAYDRSGPGLVTVASALGAGGEARLYALRLIPPTDRASFVLTQQDDGGETAALSPLLERARALGVTVRPLAFVSPKPAEDICNVADVKQADLVLLGWHKPLVGHAALGGTVHDVMRRARADVAVLIDRGLDELRSVLVPYLGGAHDRGALRLAERLARHAGARVTVLHVVSPDAPAAEHTEPELARLAAAAKPEDASGITVTTLVHADPAHALVEESAAGYDLVLIGVAAEWGLEHRPFGIQPEHVIRHCPTSLLVVRQAAPLAAPAAVRAPARAARATLAPARDDL